MNNTFTHISSGQFEIPIFTSNESSAAYRYGVQSLSREKRNGRQEKDNEVKGEGNFINYKFRMHSLSLFYGNSRANIDFFTNEEANPSLPRLSN